MIFLTDTHLFHCEASDLEIKRYKNYLKQKLLTHKMKLLINDALTVCFVCFVYNIPKRVELY